MKFSAAITLTNKLDELNRLVDFIGNLTEKWQITPKTSMNVNLALEEIITNTIHYGYSDNLPHFINIDITYHKPGKELIIKVVDDGNPFNPYTAEIPDVQNTDVEKRKVGGLGIYLVRQLMDKFDYEWSDMRNIVTLTKKIDNDY